MPPLTLREASLGDAIRLDAEGGLDAYTCDQLSRAFEALFRSRRHRIVLCLEKIEYLSSAGAGAVFAALAEARSKGGDVVILKPSEAARSVFQALGVLAVIHCTDSKEGALAILAGIGR